MNYCVSCGELVPEGRQVCPTCEKSPASIQPRIREIKKEIEQMTGVEKQIFAELRSSYATEPAYLAAIDAVERDIIEMRKRMRENPTLAAHAEGGYTSDYSRGLKIFGDMVRAKVITGNCKPV